MASSQPFDNWSDPAQDIWLDMVDNAGSYELLADDDLMAFWDIAFNTEKGEISREERWDLMQSIRTYVNDEYGFDFFEVIDWQEWREMYGGQE